jgi:hypothetical protein
MSKLQQIIAVISGMVLAAVIWGFARNRLNHRNSVTAGAYQVGQDLITTTNSPHLTGLRPGLSGRLSILLSSPTRVAAVLPGDESAPVGDGSACSRLVLTNQLGNGLELRLGYAAPDRFEILGYWPIVPHSPPR